MPCRLIQVRRFPELEPRDHLAKHVGAHKPRRIADDFHSEPSQPSGEGLRPARTGGPDEGGQFTPQQEDYRDEWAEHRREEPQRAPENVGVVLLRNDSKHKGHMLKQQPERKWKALPHEEWKDGWVWGNVVDKWVTLLDAIQQIAIEERPERDVELLWSSKGRTADDA